jgi:23S rRNA (cytidine1920-2'-O)/16S rRNA (cytidine1409-2'-O)-methyltransferase
MRVDQALVERGLVASRALAKRLIDTGSIKLDNKLVKKASEWVDSDNALTVSESIETRYVSRAGAKLAGALQACGVLVQNRVCLDLGQSTGGFTDCLLQHGAAHVIGVDVGHNQLVANLRNHSAVTVIEGCNIRELDLQTNAQTRQHCESISLVVIDVSFISLALIFPAVNAWFAKTTQPVEIVSLVKPQFEVGKGNVSKQGLVTQTKLLDNVRQKILALSDDLTWQVDCYIDSAIQGGDGNKEFFLHAFINPSNNLSA